MKLIKDMAQQELERIVAKVVLRTTDRVDKTLGFVVAKFKEIEYRLDYDLEYPNMEKEKLLKEIRELIKVTNEKIGELDES